MCTGGSINPERDEPDLGGEDTTLPTISEHNPAVQRYAILRRIICNIILSVRDPHYENVYTSDLHAKTGFFLFIFLETLILNLSNVDFFIAVGSECNLKKVWILI